MTSLVEGGRKWSEVANAKKGRTLRLWVSEEGNYELMHLTTGKFRLLSHLHTPTTPGGQYWIKDYDTLTEAAEQAEKM